MIFDSVFTLIYGAGDCGILVARELLSPTMNDRKLIGFIDDDPHKHKLTAYNLPVLGDRKAIASIVSEFEVKEIIIAIPSAPKTVTSEIINLCISTGAKVRIIPGISDMLNGRISFSTIRDVDVEDLLGRDQVKTDLVGIAEYVQDKVVLVTGAGGSIGSELCRQIAPFQPSKLLLLGHGENSIYNIEMELKSTHPHLHIEPIIADIQDRARIETIFALHRPRVVFHAAAHKHVPLMEKNPSEAVKNNVFGTQNVADCSDQYGVERFVLISSDKAVNPTSVMGATKRIAEMYVQSLNARSNTKFASVRFGNVLGSRGSVIPLFKKQIAKGGPITVTHPDMVRYFMTIPEAVQLVIQAGAMSKGGEIFILDMGEPVRILKLAEDLIRLSGYEPYEDIDIEFTGIRNGEKLFEELLTAEEGATKSGGTGTGGGSSGSDGTETGSAGGGASAPQTLESIKAQTQKSLENLRDSCINSILALVDKYEGKELGLAERPEKL
ncbi:polysaccharide biosynthesis protein [Cohnella thermotolerans]|uniref:polysaccharide biosynthesis protein n=1 Tax=Cohnella thermotolerans TaxID=329858 RepID=UPI00040C6E0A|nr:nucleoside-diphosphate sugar epimerase/dehydratase [Cohnella thermotolerans]